MIITNVLSHVLIGLDPRTICYFSNNILNIDWLIFGNLNRTIEETSDLLDSLMLWDRRYS